MRKFGIITNVTRDEELNVTRKVIEYLLLFNTEIYAEEYLSIENITLLPKDEIFKTAECIITIGGDGTIIHAAKPAAMENKPVIGINCGRIGFIAELEKDEIELLNALINDEFEIEERTVLEAKVKDKTYYCFNDAVIAGGTVSKIMEFSLCHNGKKVSDYRADGMVFSTPTGSTAYNLSAGGPIVDASMNCIIVTPVCSHSLSSRPMIFSNSSKLKVTVKTDDCYLTIDGEMAIPIKPFSEIEISNSKITVKLIKIKNSAFYEVLQAKLGGCSF